MTKRTSANSANTDPLLNRVPPHDTDAEQSVLSAIFINNEVLFDVVDILSADDFYTGAHKKIYQSILDLFSKGEPADLVTVANALNEKGELESIGGPAFLAGIADAAPVAVNAAHYARIIQGKASLRSLIDASTRIIERCLDETGDVDDIVDFSESSIFRVSEKKSSTTLRSIGELIDNNIDKLEAQQGKANGMAGMTTGYKRLDKITSGLQGSDLIILAARPSMGKTAFALNIARNVALEERRPVAIFSLEMSNEQLSMRLLTSEARIDSARLKNGFISQEDWQNVTHAASLINELPIFIDDSPNITAMEIKAKARKLMQKHGDLALIIIDYLQLMRASAKFDRRDLEIAEISRSLKALAKEFNIPVIALSQLNRMLEQRADRRPMMSDLRESGALEQDADIVAFIYRDEVYHKEDTNPKKGTAEIIVSKNRNGETGVCLMHFHGAYTRFEELAPDAYQDYQ